MREYETLFIVRPDCQEAVFSKLNEKVTGLIAKHAGVIFKNDDYGMKTLAYDIEKQSKGRYVCLDYAADTTAVADLERILRYDESVMRFLTISLSEEVDVEARKAKIIEDKKKLAEALAAGPVHHDRYDSGIDSSEEGE